MGHADQRERGAGRAQDVLAILGPLITQRGTARGYDFEDNRFACALRVLKDKRRGPTWSYEDFYTGPAGLC